MNTRNLVKNAGEEEEMLMQHEIHNASCKTYWSKMYAYGKNKTKQQRDKNEIIFVAKSNIMSVHVIWITKISTRQLDTDKKITNS